MINAFKIFKVLFVIAMFHQLSYGQNSAIELINNRFIELNVENMVQVVIERTDCDSIFIKSEAKVSYEGNCLWIIEPNKFYKSPGLLIEVFEIRNADTVSVEKKYLRVRALRAMMPRISNLKNLDSVSVDLMNAQIGMTAFNSEWDKTGCYSGVVSQFSCLLIRQNEVIGFTFNTGAKFDYLTKKLLKELLPNDELHFINILADSPIRKNEQLSSIKLFIK